MRVRPIAALLLLVVPVACTSLRHTRAPERLAGTFNARLTITGRSTYTGSFVISAWNADSVRATIKLTAPVAIDAPVSGRQVGDTLRLHGTYTAGNGCTGTMDMTLVVATAAAGARGPVSMVDRCVGALAATIELTR